MFFQRILWKGTASSRLHDRQASMQCFFRDCATSHSRPYNDLLVTGKGCQGEREGGVSFMYWGVIYDHEGLFSHKYKQDLREVFCVPVFSFYLLPHAPYG